MPHKRLARDSPAHFALVVIVGDAVEHIALVAFERGAACFVSCGKPLANKRARGIVRRELGKVGQIGGGAKAELLQKRARRGVKRRVPWSIRNPRFAHEAFFHQGVDRAVGVHAAHARHLGARRGLGICHNRERLHGGLGELAGVPGKDVLLDELVVGGMRVQPPTARHLAQLDAAVFGLELIAKPHEGALDVGGVDFEHIGECDGAHRLVGHEQHCLDCACELVFLQTFEHGYSSSPTDVSASSPVRSSSPDPSM